MPTSAVIPRSAFIPRMARPPYSHVENSRRPELDRLGLTALRAMVDVEPYGSSDLGGDPSDDEPPSMTSASPSEDDDPEDPENPSGRKKKKKRKTKRPEGRRSQEAKAIATSKIVMNLPEFTGKDLSKFAENFGRFLRMTGQTHASGRVKCDLLLQCCKTKYLEKQVRHLSRRVGCLGEAVPYRPLRQGVDPEPGRAAPPTQTSQDLRATGGPGPLGGTTDARFRLQRRAALLVGG